MEEVQEERLKYHEVIGGKIKIKIDTRAELLKSKYGVYGHATVELCHWTKSSLSGGPSCYKYKFYGAPVGGSHRCVEFGPMGMVCSNRCVYCWRPTDAFDSITPSSDEVMEPEDLLNGVLAERRRLLSGYFGHPEGKKKIREALEPTHFAISLSGEPTLYPKLPELVKLIRSLPNTKSIFIVTNGEHPEAIERLVEENALPTQLYLSCNAPNKALFNKINVPVMKGEAAWDSWLRTLKMLPKLGTRTVVRITLIKGWNTDPKYVPEFAELMRAGSPHFIEVKSYMHLGHSVYRLGKENMLSHEEVREWANKLLRELGTMYEFMDEDVNSRIVVLRNTERRIDRWIEKPTT
ncbi:MAG: 4-demethylwyosine synthase TYW1 [Thermocladium sp.]